MGHHHHHHHFPLSLSVTHAGRGEVDRRAGDEVDGGEDPSDHEEGGGAGGHYHHHHHHCPCPCPLPMQDVVTWTGEPGMKWTEKMRTLRSIKRMGEKEIITITTITITTTTTHDRYLCAAWRRGRASRG